MNEPQKTREIVSIRLRPDLVEKIDAEGKAKGWTRSTTVQEIVEAYFRAKQKNQTDSEVSLGTVVYVIR